SDPVCAVGREAQPPARLEPVDRTGEAESAEEERLGLVEPRHDAPGDQPQVPEEDRPSELPHALEPDAELLANGLGPGVDEAEKACAVDPQHPLCREALGEPAGLGGGA